MVNATPVSEKIEIDDLGPIHHLEIPLPPGGGVCLLKGQNDAGKSETLNAVEALVRGRGAIEKRDGAARGEIRWGEARLTIVKQQRRDGAELAMVALDSRLDLADLVEPGLVDPAKADAVRIKALVQLGGVQPDITLFHQLAEDKSEFDEIVRPEVSECDDLVSMAAMIKRDFEAASRKEANLSENYQGQATGHREASEGYDPSIESDAKVLQSALEEAIREQQRIASECANAAKHNELIAEAKNALADVKSKSVFPPVPEAEDAHRAAKAALDDARSELNRLEDSIRDLRGEIAKLESAELLAVRTLAGSRQHENTLGEWAKNSRLEAMRVPEAELSASNLMVDSARIAIEQGAIQRDKAVRRCSAETATNMALKAKRRAEKLRDAAKATDDILSGLVSRCGTQLRVERGRLVTDHDRGVIPFSELSDGTRWKIAIDIGIEALARAGVATERMILVIPQVAWSELSPKNRRAIDRHARERGVHVLTAIATDDELVSAEPFSAA